MPIEPGIDIARRPLGRHLRQLNEQFVRRLPSLRHETMLFADDAVGEARIIITQVVTYSFLSPSVVMCWAEESNGEYSVAT